MRRAYIKTADEIINIAADEMIQDGDYLYLYRDGGNLVGMVRWETIISARITETKGKGDGE